MHRQIIVGIMNTSKEITGMLEDVMNDCGYAAVSAFTYQFKDNINNFDKFIKLNKPDVIIYDISIPYDENYFLFEKLKARSVVGNIPFVVTTTNKQVLESMVGKTKAFELVGKPYDLEEIINSVKKAVAGQRAATVS